MSAQNLIRIAAVFVTLALYSCSNTGDSNKASAYVERSAAYQAQGQFRAALIEMRNAIKADPNNVDYAIQYADVLTTIGSANQTEQLLSIYKDDQLEKVRLPLAEAMLKQGKFISAKELLEGWTPNDSEQALHSRLTALQLFLAGNTNDALKFYREAAGNKDTDLETKYEFITLLIQSGLTTEAAQWTTLLLQSNPNDPNFLYYSAKLAHLKGDRVLAEQQLTEALKYLPDTDMLLNSKLQVLDLLTTVLTESGKHTEAVIYNNIIKEANPEQFVAKQQYKDALEAASIGDLSTAKAAFEDILNQFPNNQQAAILLGLIHLEEGDINSGEALLTENINVETAPVNIIRATAIAQSEQGKQSEALAVLERALLARPDDITLLSLFGIISLNNGDDQKGLLAINKAVELDPTRTRLHLLLAQYYASKDNTPVALGHLRKAYSINPNDWPTTSYYASLLLNSNEVDEFKQVRQNILDNHIDQPSAKWLVATMDYRLGNIDEAITRLNGLVLETPSNTNITTALARLYEQKKDYDRAANMWLLSLENNPGSVNYLQSTVQAKAVTLNQADLIKWLQATVKSKPEISLPLNAALVELLVNAKQLAQVDALAAQYKDNEQPLAKSILANALKAKALLAIEQQDWPTALTNIDQALVHVPGNATLTVMGKNVAMQLDDNDDALKRLNTALEQQPTNVIFINEKAKLLALTQDNETALSYLMPFWNQQPTGALAQTYFALISTTDKTKLEAAIEQLLAVEPDNVAGIIAFAGEKLAKNDLSSAQELYERALTINENNVAALNNLAWLMKDSNTSQALSHAEKAAELAPNSASVLDTYAMILDSSGNRAKAKAVITKALELEPNNPEIQEHHALLNS